MAIVAEVVLKENAKPIYVEALGFENIKVKDKVLLEVNQITEFGFVTKSPKEKEKIEYVGKIIKLATEEDFKKYQQNLQKEKEAFPKIESCVEKLGLEMKLVDVKVSFDLSKMTITYTAEDRVDFRELVRMLAGIFKTRVELRQIGTRDEAKLFGGFGCCGQELCCRRFLKDYRQVSIKMAKTQSLALNPTKINGVCGKLMCCLQYEYSTYKELSEKMPAVNSVVKVDGKDATVMYQDLLKQKLTVKIPHEDGYEIKVVDLKDIK